MTLFEQLNNSYGIPQNLDFILRVLLAAVCGAVIGLERTRRYKEAGIRTHLIVCCGAALAMIVSKYGFADLFSNGQFILGARGADPSRIASQVVNGIGFLGAGVIFKQGASVKGLTTAAGLWITAAIGLSIGAGMFVEAIITTIIVFVLQTIFHKYTFGGDSLSDYYLRFTAKDSEEFRQSLNNVMAGFESMISDKRVSKVNDSNVEFEITIRSDSSKAFKEMQDFLDGNKDIISVRATTVQQK